MVCAMIRINNYSQIKFKMQHWPRLSQQCNFAKQLQPMMYLSAEERLKCINNKRGNFSQAEKNTNVLPRNIYRNSDAIQNEENKNLESKFMVPR